MKDIRTLIRKDIKEMKRTKKLLILVGCEIVMSLMVLFATLLFPKVLSFINNAAPDLLKNLGNIDSVMTGLCPITFPIVWDYGLRIWECFIR